MEYYDIRIEKDLLAGGPVTLTITDNVTHRIATKAFSSVPYALNGLANVANDLAHRMRMVGFDE